MKFSKKFHTINALIVVFMIVIPSFVLASVPTTTSFDRFNIYRVDGFRDAGYHAVRHNPANWGFMNMSHVGGSNEFNITSNNIQNLTLDFDLMFANRKSLFGWDSVSWEEMVEALDEVIVINIDSDDGIDQLRFVDHPQVYVRVLVDGVVYQNWSELSDVVIENNIPAGQTEVTLEFNIFGTLYDLVYALSLLIIVVGIVAFITRLMKWAFHPDDSSYYKKYWREK